MMLRYAARIAHRWRPAILAALGLGAVLSAAAGPVRSGAARQEPPAPRFVVEVAELPLWLAAAGPGLL